MYYDPVTLVVAPTQEGLAEGSLYLDDEHTLAHEADGEFVYRKFQYKNNVLTCDQFSPISGGKTAFRPPTTVERVEIAGQSRPPKSVTLLLAVGSTRVGVDGETQSRIPLVAFYDQDRQVITIKKPDCHVADAWSIALEF